MAANLKKVADKVRDNSRGKVYSSIKPKETKIKSTGTLAQRPTGRPPFAAWAEQERRKERQFPLRAEYSAADEEKRIESILAEKEQKLKKFQHDVKERVKALEKAKQLQQLDKSYEAVTAEQKIIYQSSFPKRIATSKKDTCVYREANYASLQVGIPGTCKYGYSVVNDPDEVNIASELLDKQVLKVQRCTRHARKVLESQILNIDTDNLTLLPGGVWNRALTVTQAAPSESRTLPSMQPRDCKSSSQECEEVDSNIQKECREKNSLHELKECKEIAQEVKDMSMHEDASAVSNKQNEENIPCQFEHSNISEHLMQPDVPKVVKYKVTEDLLRPKRIKEQTKKQEQKQLAVYRRLFMDIEREQVRENLRMKEHRKRMAKLKNKQETNRKEVEYEIDEIIEERNQVTQEKSLLEKKLNENSYYSEIRKEQKKAQKEKELERYVQALRATLKEKLVKRRLYIPSLCSCGLTIFDTNPETCANNCIFYKNHKGYAKALSSILSTSDLDL